MQVYAVFLVLGQTIASIGPWPSDIAACRAHLPESNRKLDATFANPSDLAKLHKAWPGVRRDQMGWACIEADKAPEIKDAVRVR